MTDIQIILETPRLALRQFTEDDVDNLFDLNSDPEVVRTTPYEGTDVIEGAEHGEVEYAITKPEWETRTAGEARD